VIETVNLDESLQACFVKGYEQDPTFQEIYQTLKLPKEEHPAESRHKLQHYELQGSLLFYRANLEGSLRLCVPDYENLRQNILHDVHDANIAGHFGFDKTYDLIQRSYYWPKQSITVRSYVSSCDSCQRNKASTQRSQGLLQPLDSPSCQWDQVSLDLITSLPRTKRGYDAIVVFVDRLTKMAHFCPTTNEVSGEGVAQLFFDNIFRLHGLPAALVSDRDPRFTGKFWEALFRLLGTKLAMSTSLHPQTDGQTERTNRTLEQVLHHYVSYDQSDWDTHLSAVEFAYNNAVQSSTRETPFMLNYGHHPRSNIIVHRNDDMVPAAADFALQMENLVKITLDNLELAQSAQEHYANEHRHELLLEVGQWVLVDAKHIYLNTDSSRTTQKLSPKFVGPYPVIRKVSHVAYELALPSNIRVHPVFHVSCLKPYQDNPAEFSDRVFPRPPPVLVESQEEWEVEKVLAKRSYRNKVQYLVKWVGYPNSENTWEPVANLQNAREKVLEFEERGVG